MKKLSKFSTRHPLIFSIIILLLAIAFTEIPLEPLLKNYMDIQTATYITIALEQGVCAVILVVLIKALGLLKSAGFTKPRDWSKVWLVWPIIVLTVLNGWSLFDGTIVIDSTKPMLIILFILLNASVGFFEEILCRGMMLTVLLKKWGNTQKGIYLSVLISSFIFGLVHILNFIMGRSTLPFALTQMAYAMFFGVFFAACLLRTNSIWPAIITHAVFDAFGSINEIAVGGSFGQIHQLTLEEALSTIAVTLPLMLAYGLFILRKAKSVGSLDSKNGIQAPG